MCRVIPWVFLTFVLIFTDGALGGEPTAKTSQEPKAQTWQGHLSSSSEEGLALVRVQPEDPKAKSITIYLYAKQGDGNTAKTIQELISKKPYVSVTGILAPDGKSVQVSSISETEPPKKGKKK